MRNNAREEILLATNGGLGVFRHYLPDYPIPSRVNFRSPFYEDAQASCNIFEGRDGIWRYKDHGDGGQDSGDCFWFVGRLYGKSLKTQFPDILDIIINDLSLPILSPLTEQDRKARGEVVRSVPERRYERIPSQEHSQGYSSEYSYKAKPYSREELDFWGQYGITPEALTRYMVYSLQEFSSISRAGKPYTIRSSRRQPMFGYVRSENVKLYRPKSKLRFLSGGVRDRDYIFGLEQLPKRGDHVVITGGEKDVLTLASHGFNAVSLNSETAHLPEELVEDLSNRFGELYVCYDMDATGLKAAERLRQAHPTIKVLHLPLNGTSGSKDVSDYFKMGGSTESFAHLLQKCRLTPKKSSIVTEAEQILGADWKQERVTETEVRQNKVMKLV